MRVLILLCKLMMLVVTSSSVLLLAGCLGKKQAEPLVIAPIVIPAGVPPVKNHDYYENIPVIPITNPNPKQVSLLPPGSLISREEQQKKAKS